MQTASQIMAAKRAAKQQLKIKRETHSKIGDGRATGNRNEVAQIEHRQRQVRAALLYGEIADSEIRLDDDVRNWLAINDLVYCKNLSQTFAVFEKLIRAMRVVSALYNDKELHSTCRQAQYVLANLRELSPNAMRVQLQPLMHLANYCTAYGEILPADTQEKIARYCTAVQVALYSAALYDNGLGSIDAMLAIINGQSLPQAAKLYGIKQNELRQRILNTAWDFYKVVECFVSVPEPKGIPDLRHPAYAEFADPDHLKAQIRLAIKRMLIPFENATGISLVDYPKLKQKIIHIQTKHRH